ncbi:MAG: hypothetical protein JSS02_25070, partial [Planctomycetes bacterium]|nr:hypothetical protein [Planctomycetota bacterium]
AMMMMGGARGGRKFSKNKSTKKKSESAEGSEDMQAIPMTEFTVQFVWQETPESKRLPEDKFVADEAKKKAQAAGTAAPGTQPAPGVPNAGVPNTGAPNPGQQPGVAGNATPPAGSPPAGAASGAAAGAAQPGANPTGTPQPK